VKVAVDVITFMADDRRTGYRVLLLIDGNAYKGQNIYSLRENCAKEAEDLEIKLKKGGSDEQKRG